MFAEEETGGMKIAVACDHGGLNLKKAVLAFLERTVMNMWISAHTPPIPAIIPISR